jgi:hypothetical protein
VATPTTFADALRRLAAGDLRAAGRAAAAYARANPSALSAAGLAAMLTRE